MKVYVRDKFGSFMTCQQIQDGWRCGFCMRGIIVPKKGYQCKVCKCRVSQVIAAQAGPFGIEVKD